MSRSGDSSSRRWWRATTPVIATGVELERPCLTPLPIRRSCDYGEVRVRVTSPGGFVFRKVFYTVLARLICYELKLRAFDDRLELFLGSTALDTLPRGRAPGLRAWCASQCRRLSPRDPQPAQEPRCSGQPRLPGRPLPPDGISELLGGAEGSGCRCATLARPRSGCSGSPMNTAARRHWAPNWPASLPPASCPTLPDCASASRRCRPATRARRCPFRACCSKVGTGFELLEHAKSTS